MFEKKELQIYKIRFVVLSIVITCLLFLFLMMIRRTFSSYVSDTNINVISSNAAYIFNEGKMSFNLDINKIIPSNTPYVYEFTISNYNEFRKSDIDIFYNFNIKTTTNLPLTYEVYYDKNYIESGATNIITNTEQIQDEDNTWYNYLTIDKTFDMPYKEMILNKYFLVVEYPLVYSNTTDYEGMIDNIEVIIESKQKVE